MIESMNGETIFDGTNTERVVTHRIYIRYLPGVTAEAWILFDGVRYNILDVEDLDARKEWLRLRCTIRGVDTNSVNAA